MLNFTDTAKTRIASFLELQRSQGVTALRVAGNRTEYKLWLVKESDKQSNVLSKKRFITSAKVDISLLKNVLWEP